MNSKEVKSQEGSYVLGYGALCADLSSKYNPLFNYEVNKRYELDSEKDSEVSDIIYRFCLRKEDVFNNYPINGINNYKYFEIKVYGASIDSSSGKVDKLFINGSGVSIEFVRGIPIQEFISDIEYIRIIKEIPTDFDLSTLNNLKSLELNYCNSLKSLPEKLPKNLEKIEIYSCNSLTPILESSLPENLKSLEIWGCDKIKNQSWSR